MRPVEKWNPENEPRINDNYPNYKDAKHPLYMNLGTICSYCEKAYDDERDLQVEHIQPKKYKDADGNYIYAHLETAWSNFLLSCPTCNGADNKDTKNVVYGSCHLPHLNNTFLSLCYKAGGVVEVNPSLSGKSANNARALLELVGLNKGPKDSSAKNYRWRIRLEKWNLANIYLEKYIAGSVDVYTIVDLVKGHGCWSIWFTVFKGHDEVRKALIEEFPGTAASCFDAQNHFEPICRNPLDDEDPV